VDVEHRVALAVARQHEDRLRLRHHLAGLGHLRDDDAVGLGLELGVAELVVGLGELALGLCQLRLCRAGGRVGLVVLATGGIAGRQQILLAFEGAGRLPQGRLGRLHAGLGGLQLGLLLVGIEPGQHLVGGDVVADIGQPRGDLAADPERHLALHLGGDRAGQGDLGREVCNLGRDDVDALKRRWRAFLSAAGQQGQHQQAAHEARTH
jgi:hypothetical protein